MKQRFLNQKLGKRMSRKAELQKAKAERSVARRGSRKAKSKLPRRPGEFVSGSAPLSDAG